MPRRHLPGSTAWAPIALVAVGLSGCSFAFVEGPPREHRRLPLFDCTSRYVAPALDGAYTALQLAQAGLAAAASDADFSDQAVGRGATIGLSLAFAGLGAASMLYGFSRVSACREAKQELLLRLTAPPAAVWPPPAGAPGRAP